jgi:hypothetical protein
MISIEVNLVQEEYLLVPNKEDPFGGFSATTKAVVGIDTGVAFCRGFCKVREDHANPPVVGIMLYMDHLHYRPAWASVGLLKLSAAC